ncbi:rod-binding protein [Tropicimonas aquimaris]|uniref:Rod-binding protein n=1 Tax=Tropicimonas aquimaris TaxID=914152 RepID=A0ABW3IPJ2_9RHOB
MQKILDTSQVTHRALPSVDSDNSDLRRVARDLESSFLSEMLGHAGLGETSGTFGGGIGEEQFSSFLRDVQAQEIAAHGGIGLAEAIFDALKESADVG